MAQSFIVEEFGSLESTPGLDCWSFLLICNIVIYKGYILGHSDDQNSVLIYVWSLSTVSGSQVPKPLTFS